MYCVLRHSVTAGSTVKAGDPQRNWQDSYPTSSVLGEVHPKMCRDMFELGRMDGLTPSEGMVNTAFSPPQNEHFYRMSRLTLVLFLSFFFPLLRASHFRHDHVTQLWPIVFEWTPTERLLGKLAVSETKRRHYLFTEFRWRCPSFHLTAGKAPSPRLMLGDKYFSKRLGRVA